MGNTSIEQRIIGTWVGEKNGAKWVFNANGTGTNDEGKFRFGVTDTQVAIKYEKYPTCSVFNISMSSDGRTMILNHPSDFLGHWLTRSDG